MVGNAISDWMREFLWGIAKLLLWLLDFVWDVVLRVAKLDIYSNGNVGLWFILISTTLVLFITFRVVKIFIKFYFSEDYKEKLNIGRTLIMMSLTTLLVSLAPFGMKYVTEFSISLIDNVAFFIPTENSSQKMSDVILNTNMLMKSAEEKQEFEQYKKEEIKNLKELAKKEGQFNTQGGVATIYGAFTKRKNISVEQLANEKFKGYEGVDITKKVGTKYLFFDGWSSLFLLIITSAVCTWTFLGIAFSIAKRSILIFVQYFAAPYAIASIIDPESNAFGQWVTTIGSNLMMNFAQIFATYFVMSLANNTSIASALSKDNVGLAAQIVFMVGGFMAINSIPQFIGRITGGETAGINEALNEAGGFKAFGKLTGAISSGIGGLAIGSMAGFAGGAMQGYQSASNYGKIRTGLMTAAGAVWGVGSSVKAGLSNGGIATGGAGTNGMSRFKSALRSGAKSSTAVNGGNPGFMSPINESSDSMNDTAFSQEPTESQLRYAEKLGIENASDMSKGELSQELEAYGAERSYWHNHERTTPSSTRDIEVNKTGNSMYENQLNARIGQRRRKIVLNGKPYKE